MPTTGSRFRYNGGMTNKWIDIKLLNGWKAVDGFRSPQYKIDEKGWVDFRGSGTGPSGKAIGFIGPEYEGRNYYNSFYEIGFIETWVIDKDGYLYFYPYKKEK